MIRVLMVNAVGGMGGAEWSLLELATALRNRDCALTVALPDGRLRQALEAEGLPCLPLATLRLHRPRSIAEVTRDIDNFRKVRKTLRQTLAAVQPQVLHANGTTAALLTQQFLPQISTCLRIWHCRDLMQSRLLCRVCARGQNRVIATSKPVEAQLKVLLARNSRTRIVRIDNGINLDRFTAHNNRNLIRQQLGWPKQAPVVVMLAHLVPWKRHDRFVDVMAGVIRKHPEAQGFIVGNDPYREHQDWAFRVDAQIRRIGLHDRVHRLVSATPVPDLLAAADILLHPPTEEPFGRVICEAMAAGCPVVAMRSAGPAGILVHGQTGWLCKPGSEREITQSLSEAVNLLLETPHLRQSLVRAARHAVAQNYDIHDTADKVKSLYNSLTLPSDNP